MVNFDNENLSPSILEHRVYPWLSFEYPVYERWTGKVQYQPPKMANYVKDGNQNYQKTKYNNDKHLSSFFLNRLKQNVMVEDLFYQLVIFMLMSQFD